MLEPDSRARNERELYIIRGSDVAFCCVLATATIYNTTDSRDHDFLRAMCCTALSAYASLSLFRYIYIYGTVVSK